MTKCAVRKKILKYVIIVAGFIPANYLLFFAVLLLIGNFANSDFPKDYDFEDMKFLLSLILGIFGYVGLFLSIIPLIEKKWFLIVKIICLISGILGFMLFLGSGDSDFSESFISLFNFKKYIKDWDWYAFVLPNVVSIILIVYYGYKLIQNHKVRQKTK